MTNDVPGKRIRDAAELALQGLKTGEIADRLGIGYRAADARVRTARCIGLLPPKPGREPSPVPYHDPRPTLAYVPGLKDNDVYVMRKEKLGA
jgi:hypothetical protein